MIRPGQLLSWAALALLGSSAGAQTSVYAHTRAGMFSPVVRGVPARVYVPNGKDNTVSVINPATYTVIRTFKVDQEPQHVVASYDLKTLWVASDKGRQSLTPIDPQTRRLGRPVPTSDPYNLYFTPDGRYGLVVAENQRQLNFTDPHNMQVQFSIKVLCRGINHMDFSADGHTLLAACEFSGDVLKIDLKSRRVTGLLHLGGMPQDVKLSPDGQVYYVADMMADGVHVIDGESFTQIGFVPTGVGAHGLYPSRDGKRLYVANRGSNLVRGKPHGPGSISVIDFASGQVVQTWPIPNGGSPDMGNVSADGKYLWLSGRYDDEVYRIETTTGAVDRVPVGKEPHGLTVWPQPGRYSLGHTGNLR